MILDTTNILYYYFDTGTFLGVVGKEKDPHMFMVPVKITEWLNHRDFKPEELSSLKILQNVHAPLLLKYKHILNETLPGIF